MAAGLITTRALGQSGYRMAFPETVVYVDPYLSDNVERIEGTAMRRLFPLPIIAETVRDADWVLITHIHLDHCDLHTLLPLGFASPQCRFLCPRDCVAGLTAAGIAQERILAAPESWITLGHDLRAVAVPAAHPTVERDDEGCLRFVGYVLEHAGRRFYHAGDTSPSKEIIGRLGELAPIDVAFLPVNERNYYRDVQGIIGNMTIREAFQLATDIGAKSLVPMHWDMFAPNSVYLEEIELLYRLIAPPFKLWVYPQRM
jgi:L-ascorbate 6-phosphate lactonase